MNGTGSYGRGRKGPASSMHSFSVCKNRISESDARNCRNFRLGVRSFEPGEMHLLLRRKVSLDVATCRVRALVLQPQRDHVGAETMCRSSVVRAARGRVTLASEPERRDKLFLVEIYA